MTTTDPLETLRRLCLALPETTERLSHGEPTWFVRGRTTFVTYADHHHDDRLAFWCAAPPGTQEALVASDPERFAADIAERLNSVLADPALADRMGKAGRRRAVEQFSWSAIAAETAALYASLT